MHLNLGSLPTLLGELLKGQRTDLSELQLRSDYIACNLHSILQATADGILCVRGLFFKRLR